MYIEHKYAILANDEEKLTEIAEKYKTKMIQPKTLPLYKIFYSPWYESLILEFRAKREDMDDIIQNLNLEPISYRKRRLKSAYILKDSHINHLP